MSYRTPLVTMAGIGFSIGKEGLTELPRAIEDGICVGQ